MRMAKRAKAYAAGSLDVDDGLDEGDEEEDEVIKKPARKGRPPKKASQAQDEGEAGAEGQKKAVRRSTKKTAESPKEVTKTKVLGKASSLTSSKKKTSLVYEEIGSSDEDSEVTERFDFDTEEEDAVNVAEEEASDAERRTAFFAAAEGSLEMQADDVESSPSNSPSSQSFKGSSASPTKRRRKASVNSDTNELPDLLQGLRATTTGAREKAGTNLVRIGGRPAVLEMSDSE